MPEWLMYINDLLYNSFKVVSPTIGYWCLWIMVPATYLFASTLFSGNHGGVSKEMVIWNSDLNWVGVDDISSHEKLEKATRTLPSSDVFELSTLVFCASGFNF